MLLLPFTEETEELAYRSGKFVDKKEHVLGPSTLQVSFPATESSSFSLGTGE